MTNAERAKRASHALHEYAGYRGDRVSNMGLDEAVQDLITDLFHLLEEEHGPPYVGEAEEVCRCAISNFEEERRAGDA